MSVHVSQDAEKSSKSMRIALAANGRTDVALSVREITWDQLCTRLSTPKIGAKDGSYYLRGGDLIEPKRADENLKKAEFAVIDGDSSFDPETGELLQGAPPLEKTVRALEDIGVSFFAHTTHSFRQDDEGRWVWKYRVLIPAEIGTPEELDAVVTYVIDQLHTRGVYITDVPENRRWSQPWYMPRVGTKDDLAFFRSHRFDGKPLNVAEAVAWNSARKAQEAAERSLPLTQTGSIQAPTEGLGDTTHDAINAFNDANGLDFVRRTLEAKGYRFVYKDKRGPGGEAYRYVRPNSSTGQPGVVVFRGSRGHWCVFSHHGIEDPLSGKVCDPFDLVATFSHNGDRKAAARALLPKKEREPSIAEQINARHTAASAEPAEAFPQENAKPAPAPQKRKIELVMAQELKDEPIAWLIDNLVPAKGFAALYGKPGSYKSFVALYLAGMISTGRQAFDRATTQGDVVYVAGEGGAGLKRRWDALKIQHQLPEDARIAFVRAQLNLRSTLDDLEALLIAIKERSLTPQLVIIDTLARAFAGGNENSSEDMGAFISIMGKLQEDLGAAVMIVHHSGKDEARGQRGHSSLLGAVDAELEVVKVSEEDSPDRIGKLTITKQKDGEDGVEIGYRMVTVQLSKIDFDKSSLAVEPMDQAPQPQRERRRKASRNELLALQALRKAVEECGRTVSSNHIPVDAKCVEIPEWRRYWGQISPLKDDSAKRVFNREIRSLGQAGQISVWGEYVWISEG